MNVSRAIKTAIIAAAYIAATPVAHAQNITGATIQNADHPNIVGQINDCPGVTLSQPDALTQRLAWDSIAPKAQNDAKTTRTASRYNGYRVEVFSDNNPRTAKATASIKKRNLQSRFPNYPVYLIFESPFWRVRLGDFKNKGEAEGALQEIRSAFPAYAKDLRIVKTTISN